MNSTYVTNHIYKAHDFFLLLKSEKKKKKKEKNSLHIAPSVYISHTSHTGTRPHNDFYFTFEI